jgi:hypothetical protein
MFTMSPNDNPISTGSSSLKDRNFGGNRKITKDVQKAEDYTKPSQERRANLDGEVEEVLIAPDAIMDIDDMNDPNARKREVSRRAETSTVGADNQYRRPGDGDDKTYSDADNRPKQDNREDEVREPNPEVKHGSRNPWRIGEDRDKPGDQNIGIVGPKPR